MGGTFRFTLLPPGVHPGGVAGGGPAGSGGGAKGRDDDEVERREVALRTPRELWERGAVEVGVVGVAAALLLGTVVGTGAASTVVDVADGVTWVSDEDSGQVVEINPSTGRPQRAVQVARPGTGLTLGQRDGVLVLTDDEGLSTAIDLSTLVASGSRAAGGPGRTKVLVEGGGVYLVELERGTVRAVDPLTLEDLGRPLRTAALSDAVVDDRGTVWTAGNDGVLSSATWSAQARRFIVHERRSYDGIGEGTALVPHQQGVSVFSPGSGLVAQVGGTGEVSELVVGMTGTVLAADRSPADVAPVVDRDNATLVVITRHRRVQQIPLAATGCSEPGRPAVLGKRVYVPCAGAGKVVVFDQDGRKVDEIRTPDGQDPRMVVDDGRLLVSTRSGSTAILVDSRGRRSTITVRDDAVPVSDATVAPTFSAPPPLPPQLTSTPPPPPPTSRPPTSTTRPPTTTQSVTTGSPSTSATVDVTGPGGSGTGTGTAGGGTWVAPATRVVATETAPGTVRISWTASESGADRYVVARADGVGGATSAGATATSLTLTNVAPGAALSWVVDTTRDGRTVRSAPSAPIAVTAPGTTTTAPRPAAVHDHRAPAAAPVDDGAAPAAGHDDGTAATAATAPAAGPQPGRRGHQRRPGQRVHRHLDEGAAVAAGRLGRVRRHLHGAVVGRPPRHLRPGDRPLQPDRLGRPRLHRRRQRHGRRGRLRCRRHRHLGRVQLVRAHRDGRRGHLRHLPRRLARPGAAAAAVQPGPVPALPVHRPAERAGGRRPRRPVRAGARPDRRGAGDARRAHRPDPVPPVGDPAVTQAPVQALTETEVGSFRLLHGRVVDALEHAVKGKRGVLELITVALFSSGHVLLEDVPGTGKTTLARAVAQALGGQMRRVQFTPDLLPSDVTGTTVFDPRDGEIRFRQGPVFGHVLLADEINRAAAKTQSSLLEVMQERTVTVDGETHPVPDPFVVIATQNPVDLDGTYRLPEAQLDRFLVRVTLGFPDAEHEIEVLRPGSTAGHVSGCRG